MDCNPVIYMKNLLPHYQNLMLNQDVIVDPETTLAIPCGLNARSTFDDTYKLFRCPASDPVCTLTNGDKVGTGVEIKIDRNNITFPTDHFYYNNIDL